MEACEWNGSSIGISWRNIIWIHYILVYCPDSGDLSGILSKGIFTGKVAKTLDSKGSIIEVKSQWIKSVFHETTDFHA